MHLLSGKRFLGFVGKFAHTQNSVVEECRKATHRMDGSTEVASMMDKRVSYAAGFMRICSIFHSINWCKRTVFSWGQVEGRLFVDADC